MKNNITNFKKELTVSLVLIILLIFILNPYSFWMPSMLHMMILPLIVAFFGVFASFILREHVGDEREGSHRMFAGRVAFLAGATMLILGIVFQGLNDAIDPWLVATLVVMILGKVLALFYSERNL